MANFHVLNVKHFDVCFSFIGGVHEVFSFFSGDLETI